MTREQVYADSFFGISLELRLFLGAVLLGAVLGAVYDIFRAVRLSFKNPGWLVFFEDLLFMFLSGLAYYSFCVELCRGQIRFFALVGVIIGFSAYILTLGRLVCGMFGFAAKYVRTALGLLGKVVKKVFGVLCGVPFFKKEEEKIEENPCADGEF